MRAARWSIDWADNVDTLCAVNLCISPSETMQFHRAEKWREREKEREKELKEETERERKRERERERERGSTNFQR